MSDNYRDTELSLSFLILRLYGTHDYIEIKSSNNLPLAKKYYLKIIKSIKFSIEETITVTDRNHKTELSQIIDTYEKHLKSSKSFNVLDQLMIAFQSELIFLLIGLVPSRGQSKQVINKRDMWKLDGYRKIQYVQTPEQKKNLIFRAVQGKFQKRFGDWGDFVTKIYWRECQNKPENLIEWLKINHIDIYLELF